MTVMFLSLGRLSDSRKAKARSDTRSPQQRSDEAAIETLYVPVLGGWADCYKRAIADALYRAAWLEDRSRCGLRSAWDLGVRDCYNELASGAFDRAVSEANAAVRDRQPRPRRTPVDNRLAYYDSLT